MEIWINVKSSHWMDRAPDLELRSSNKLRDLFKKGQIESPILTAYTKVSEVKVLHLPITQLSEIKESIYSIKGKIVAGHGTRIVLDCGVLLRVEISDVALSSSITLSVGEFIEIKTKIFGFYYDEWEGIIHYRTKFKGKIKDIKRINGSSDIHLLLGVIEPGKDIMISLPYKKESKPDLNWRYVFGKKLNGVG